VINKYIDNVIIGIPKPASSTIFAGKNVQKPIKNNSAATKTEGTKALVFVDTTSPIPRTNRTRQKAIIKLIFLSSFYF
jgi:hypothetical protein